MFTQSVLINMDARPARQMGTVAQTLNHSCLANLLTTSPFYNAFWDMHLAGDSNVHLLSIFGAVNMNRLGGSNLEEMRECAISTRECFVQFPSLSRVMKGLAGGLCAGRIQDKEKSPS